MRGNILPYSMLFLTPCSMNMNILFRSRNPSPVLGQTKRLNDFVTVKYQHIVYLYLMAGLPSNSVNAAIG